MVENFDFSLFGVSGVYSNPTFSAAQVIEDGIDIRKSEIGKHPTTTFWGYLKHNPHNRCTTGIIIDSWGSARVDGEMDDNSLKFWKRYNFGDESNYFLIREDYRWVGEYSLLGNAPSMDTCDIINYIGSVELYLTKINKEKFKMLRENLESPFL